MLNNTERRGFAIPIAILVILVLTIMVAGGFSLVSAERRSVADQKSQISALDRKSTRLNSSHSQISYAVFCLKKKKKNTYIVVRRDRLPQGTYRPVCDHDSGHTDGQPYIWSL